MHDSEKLVPFREAVARIGRGVTAAYADVAEGRLQLVKNGRRSFIKESEIQRYIAALPTRGRGQEDCRERTAT